MQTVQQPTHSDSTSEKEERRQTFLTLYRTMAADWGDEFLRQFRGTGFKPKDWADRLDKRLYNCTNQQILEGYDYFVANIKRTPTTDELIQAVKSRKRADENNTFQDIPEPTAKDRGLEYIDEMKRIIANKSKPDKDQPERLRKAVEAHEALLADHSARGLIKTPLLHANPRCVYPGCPKPGTMTTSTLGSDSWLCMGHFKARNW